MAVAPERLGEAHASVEALGVLLDHAAKLLDGLGEHVAFGVEPGQAGAAKAQRGALTAPDIGIEAQQLAAQLRHIGAHLERLLELCHGAIKLALALEGDPEANVGGDILRVGVEHAAKGSLRLVELAPGQVGLAKNAVGLEVLRKLIEDVLCHPDCLIDPVGLKVAAGLIVCSLQAHRSHAGASWCTLRSGEGNDLRGWVR